MLNCMYRSPSSQLTEAFAICPDGYVALNNTSCGNQKNITTCLNVFKGYAETEYDLRLIFHAYSAYISQPNNER